MTAISESLRGARSARSINRDLDNIESWLLGSLPHSRGCGGWYRCKCQVANAERAVLRLRSDFEALRASSGTEAR